MLLGSDYTEGVAGIGVVNALEVVSAWPDGLSGLAGFKQWLESPDERILAAATEALEDAKGQRSGSGPQQRGGGKQQGRQNSGRGSRASSRGGRSGKRGRGAGRRGCRRQARKPAHASSDSDAADASAGSDSETASEASAPGAPVQDSAGQTPEQQPPQQQQQEEGSGAASGNTAAQKRFKSAHRGVVRSWHLPVSFPNSRVHDAYLQPLVDRNPAKFGFGRPNGDLLVQFCRCVAHTNSWALWWCSFSCCFARCCGCARMRIVDAWVLLRASLYKVTIRCASLAVLSTAPPVWVLKL